MIAKNIVYIRPSSYKFKKKIYNLTKEIVSPDIWGKRGSPSAARTRTPPRGKGEQSRAPWKEPVSSPHPAYHREGNIRDTRDAGRHRYTDVRQRPDYERLREQQDRLRRTQYRGSDTAEESNWSDQFPPEENVRGSMGNRRYNRTTDIREPRHYDRDRQRELRHYREDETHHPRRRDQGL